MSEGPRFDMMHCRRHRRPKSGSQLLLTPSLYVSKTTGRTNDVSPTYDGSRIFDEVIPNNPSRYRSPMVETSSDSMVPSNVRDVVISSLLPVSLLALLVLCSVLMIRCSDWTGPTKIRKLRKNAPGACTTPASPQLESSESNASSGVVVFYIPEQPLNYPSPASFDDQSQSSMEEYRSSGISATQIEEHLVEQPPPPAPSQSLQATVPEVDVSTTSSSAQDTTMLPTPPTELIASPLERISATHSEEHTTTHPYSFLSRPPPPLWTANVHPTRHSTGTLHTGQISSARSRSSYGSAAPSYSTGPPPYPSGPPPYSSQPELVLDAAHMV
ncbi:hypothetical protein BXZ70DRAFT_907023 [Cristinia sonorae]|uniref:Uncharacterized protein n=1 Tax=Cristinia sonorae TaxID=1940300 RepID=A0A8K0UPY3_9AGAR|nr:hypothetical protein BXZ70DRAFT_907023 [Cristinia sonorae]